MGISATNFANFHEKEKKNSCQFVKFAAGYLQLLSMGRLPKVCSVLNRYPQVDEAILYGSRTKGNYKNGSDIDLTLRGGKDLTLHVLLKITNEPDDLLLPYTIDLSIFDQISDPDVAKHIQRVGVMFYEKSESVLEPA